MARKEEAERLKRVNPESRWAGKEKSEAEGEEKRMSESIQLAGNQVKDHPEFWARMQSAIAKVMPTVHNAERFLVIVQRQLLYSEKLQQSTWFSFAASCYEAAFLGLEPAGSTGHCWLIPYKNSRASEALQKQTQKKSAVVYDAQMQVGYRGFIHLAARDSIKMYGDLVHQKDEFTFTKGTRPEIIHRYDIRKERGICLVAYAIARHPDGFMDFKIHDRHEADRRRARSKAATDGPWVTDFEAMWLKGVFRDVGKLTAYGAFGGVRLSQAAALDEIREQGIMLKPEEKPEHVWEAEAVAAETVGLEATEQAAEHSAAAAAAAQSDSTAEKAETGFKSARGLLTSVKQKARVTWATVAGVDYSSFDTKLLESLLQRENKEVIVYFTEKEKDGKTFRNIISIESA